MCPMFFHLSIRRPLVRTHQPPVVARFNLGSPFPLPALPLLSPRITSNNNTSRTCLSLLLALGLGLDEAEGLLSAALAVGECAYTSVYPPSSLHPLQCNTHASSLVLVGGGSAGVVGGVFTQNSEGGSVHFTAEQRCNRPLSSFLPVPPCSAAAVNSSDGNRGVPGARAGTANKR